MERQTKHQILPKGDQIRLDKGKIEELLCTHNLAENVDLIYELILECRRPGCDDTIDICVQKIIGELEEEKKKEKDILEEKPPSKNDVYSKK